MCVFSLWRGHHECHIKHIKAPHEIIWSDLLKWKTSQICSNSYKQVEFSVDFYITINQHSVPLPLIEENCHISIAI